MAIVTGLTKERMLEIEAQSVVDGDVVEDHLILTRHDGTTIDAGDVRGAQGLQGIQGVPGPEGPSAPATSLATPATLALRDANGRLRVGSPIDLADVANKGYVDTLVKGQEILVDVNLNTLTSPGIYFQSQNAEATTALNYPAASQTGLLEIFGNSDGTQLFQRYTTHGDHGNVVYTRIYWAGTWYPWKKHVAADYDDTGWVAASTAGFTAAAGATLTGGIVRKKNGMVAIQLTGLTTAAYGSGNITNVTLWNIPTGWIPLQSNGQFSAGASGSSFSSYASSGGTIVMGNTDTGMVSGTTIQAMGTYML